LLACVLSSPNKLILYCILCNLTLLFFCMQLRPSHEGARTRSHMPIPRSTPDFPETRFSSCAIVQLPHASHPPHPPSADDSSLILKARLLHYAVLHGIPCHRPTKVMLQSCGSSTHCIADLSSSFKSNQIILLAHNTYR